MSRDNCYIIGWVHFILFYKQPRYKQPVLRRLKIKQLSILSVIFLSNSRKKIFLYKFYGRNVNEFYVVYLV